MRKLILYILLLSFSNASAQSLVDYFTLVRTTGTLMGVAEYRTPPNPNGKKDPLMIWLHGVDANRSAPANANDTLRIAAVANKGPLALVKGGTHLPRFQKPGTVGIEHRYGWNVLAPQNPTSGTGEWVPDVMDKILEYARAHPEKWDTSLMVAVGYSLGGRGWKRYLNRPAILPYIKCYFDIAGGVTTGTTAQFQDLANSGIPMFFYATIDDNLVPAANIDAFVNGIKAQNPVVVPNYVRLRDITQSTTNPWGEFMANPEHDFIEFLIARDTTTGDTENTSNGDVWTKTTENMIYTRGLKFFGSRRKRSSIYWLFLFLLTPLRPRKSHQNLAA
jgi:hypothetical protein